MPTGPLGQAPARGVVEVDARGGERPIGDLLGDLANQVSGLVRQEVELARTEIAASLMQAGRGAGLTGLGGALIHAGFLTLLAAIVLGLVQTGLDPWFAALLVGALVIGVGIVMTSIGLKEVQTTDVAPRQTVASLRRDVEYVREQLR
jgi:Putative Actinobacterial Holin-X, holin superfamily III